MNPAGCTAGVVPVRDGQVLPRSSVTYRSSGVVLVIGNAEAALEAAASLPGALRPVVFAPGASGKLEAGARVVGGRVTRIEGHLGAFRAWAMSSSGESDIGAFSHHPQGHFDLVLDLSSAPVIRRSVLPPGYFAPGDEPRALGDAIAGLAALQGKFSKPKYFSYQPELCAHGSRGIQGCAKCLPACGASAIRSAGERIEVDANLCQGCAACTLACPTGALSFARPAREELLARLGAAIGVASERFPAFRVIAFEAAEREAVEAASQGKPWALLEVAPLLAFGEELWLAALALGASDVVLVGGAALPSESEGVLAAQLGAIGEILGHGAPRVSAVATARLGALPPPGAIRQAVAGEVRLDARLKRGLLHDALERIGPEPGPLAAGTALGTIHVSLAKCTLCSGCANVCPTGAIRFAGAPSVRLSFSEEACIQCGMCASACPEDAIALEPRLADAGTRALVRTLVTDEPAHCPSCGTGFMPRRQLESNLAKFGPELGLSGPDLDRLRLCPACRQVATLREA